MKDTAVVLAELQTLAADPSVSVAGRQWLHSATVEIEAGCIVLTFRRKLPLGFSVHWIQRFRVDIATAIGVPADDVTVRVRT